VLANYRVDVVKPARRIDSRHINKTRRHRKVKRAAHAEVGGIMLYNQTFSLTNPDAAGIVRGSVFFLEDHKVQLWN
jgi:hypothetical protein